MPAAHACCSVAHRCCRAVLLMPAAAAAAYHVISLSRRLFDTDAHNFRAKGASMYVCLQGQFFLSVARCPQRGLVVSKLGGRLDGGRFVLTCKKPLKTKLNGNRQWELEMLKRTVRPRYGESFSKPDVFVISPALVGISDTEDECFHPVLIELRALRGDEADFDGRVHAPRVIRLVRCTQVPQRVMDIERNHVRFVADAFEPVASWAADE